MIQLTKLINSCKGRQHSVLSWLARLMLLCLLLTGGLPGFTPVARAQENDNIDRILVIHGVWEAGPWDLDIDRAIVDELQLSEDSSVQISFEYLGIDANPSSERLEEIRTNVESMVRQQNISYIVAVQPMASTFFFDLDLPGSVSAVLLLPGQDAIELAGQRDDVAIVESASSIAIEKTVAQIVALRPESQSIYVVGGNNGDDLLYVNQVREIAERYRGELQFEYLIGIEPEELESLLGQLSPSDSVLSLPFSSYTNSQGELAAVGSVYFALMIDSLPAPLFGIYDRLLGYGLVGGSLSSIDGYAQTVGRLLRSRIDTGQWVSARTVGEAFTTYDWNEVRRWNLDLDNLDEPYELINEPVSLWRSNPVLVLVFSNIVLVLLLVVLFMAFQLRRSRAAQQAIARSEILARENEEKYRLLATNTVDVIWTWSARTEEVIYCSPSIEKLTGYTAAEFLTKPLHKWMTPESFQRCIDLYNQGASSGERLIEVEHYTRDGGTVFCEMSAHPVYQGGDPDLWVGVTRDISQRKLEESHREKLEASVRQNQKFESLGTLAGGIAHDFNNVLGVMMGLIDLLSEEVKSDSSHTLVDKLSNSAQKAKRLVQRILTFAREKEGDKKIINLTELVAETVELLASGIPPNVSLTSELPSQVIKINGDRTQIEQVIMNVATNAIEALDGREGKITFGLSTESVSEAIELPHGSLAPGEYARLIVEDSGDGISADIVERIFDPFYTRKETGSGMGLAIVRNVIVHHNGAIDIHSMPGIGTRFDILLPVAVGELSITSKQGAALPLDRSLKILVVDDQEEVLETAALMLEKMGHECHIATDPLLAMAKIAQQHDNLDLVITDYSMPGMNGIQLADRCAHDFPELRVILSTGYGEALPNNIMLTSKQILEVLHKPYSYKDLQRMVEQQSTDDQ